MRLKTSLRGGSAMKTWILMIALTTLSMLNYAAENTEELTSMKKERPIAIIETNQGTLKVELFPDVAPKAVENFITHAQNHYYDNLIFHRVIPEFMIQGGDPSGNGTGGQSIWGKNFEDEFSPSLKFDKKGKLAMANRGPATNGSQFFITTVATPWLNQKHTIFGEVIEGYDVVEKIENTPTGAQDRPLEPQKILKITIKK